MSRNSIAGACRRSGIKSGRAFFRGDAAKGLAMLAVYKRVSDVPDGSHCHWPEGDPLKPDFSWCGATAVTGKPYCAQHMKRAYVRVSAGRLFPEQGTLASTLPIATTGSTISNVSPLKE